MANVEALAVVPSAKASSGKGACASCRCVLSTLFRGRRGRWTGVMNEREAYIALNMMERVGPVGVRALVGALGSAVEVFQAGDSELRRARSVGRATVESVAQQRGHVAWEREIEATEALGGRLVSQIDPEYPEALRNIHDPPLALYVRGRLEKGDQRAVGIVGSRRPTHYGRDCTGRLSGELARSGLTIVSGLASGVDRVAHEAALRARGRTVAVLGGALDCMYPKEHAGLAGEIAGGGAVISEFPLGRRPDKTTFPMRNRIVSGLSMGVIVVEAGPRSGALITAERAMEQGKTVFAVPGRIDSRLSAGCHGLIREGAVLVRRAADVLDELELLLPRSATAGAKLQQKVVSLNENETRLIGLLDGGARDVDSLIRASGMRAGDVSSLLVSLEMKRAVRMLPGRVVERVAPVTD